MSTIKLVPGSRAKLEGEGWYIEVEVLESGQQLYVRCAGTIEGESTMIVHPASGNAVIITSAAAANLKPR